MTIEVWRKGNDAIALPARKLKGGFATMRDAESWALSVCIKNALGQRCYAAAYQDGLSHMEFRGEETLSEGA